MAQDQFNLAISNLDRETDIENLEFLKQFDPKQPVQPVGTPTKEPPPPPPAPPAPVARPGAPVGVPGAAPLSVAAPLPPPPAAAAPLPKPTPISPWAPGTIPAVVEALGFHDPAAAASGQHENINPAVLQQLHQTFPLFTQAVGEYGTVIQDARKTAAQLTAPPPPEGPADDRPWTRPLAQPDTKEPLPDLDMLKLWIQQGPQKAWEGIKQLYDTLQEAIPKGQAGTANYAPGLNQVFRGAGVTALPAMLPVAATAAPGPLLYGAAVGTGLQVGGEALAHEAGLPEDKAELVGNIAGSLSPGHVLGAAALFVPEKALSKVIAMLPDSIAGGVTKALATRPQLRRALQWLHPSELHAFGQFTPANQAEFAKVYFGLPGNEFLQAVAHGGLTKEGWYGLSREAIEYIFREDAGLFAGVLAATSPQNGVEMNLRNALSIFRGWVKAGRPTDEASIIRIMGENVVGEKGEQSILPSWKENTIRVLQGGSTISGPKVDSFWRNLFNRPITTLYGEMPQSHAMTFDAWMSNVLDIQQDYFGGKGSRLLHEQNPGYSPGYLASTARLREAATKSGQLPEQIQETMWSWAKALYEQSEATGVPAVEIIKKGLLDPKAISGTPDFGTLFHDPSYAPTIREMGPDFAKRLDTLPMGTFKEAQAPSPDQLKWQLKAAEILDNLKAMRELGSKVRTGEPVGPGRVAVTVPTQGNPSVKAGGGDFYTPEVSEKSRGLTGGNVLATNEDLRGRPIIAKGLGMPVGENAPGTSITRPEGSGPAQFDPMRAMQIDARRRGAAIHPGDERAITTAARLQGLLDRRDVVTHSGVVYDLDNPNVLHVVTPNSVKGQTLSDLQTMFPDHEIHSRADSIDILRKDGGVLTPDEATRVQATIQASYNETAAAKGKKPLAVPPVKLGRNIASADATVALPWGEPGSRQVTTKALEHYDTLTAGQKRALDSDELKASAGEKLALWLHQKNDVAKKLRKNVPDDFINALTLVKNGGVSALRKALDDPSQLLPLVLLTGLLRPAAAPTRTPTAADAE